MAPLVRCILKELPRFSIGCPFVHDLSDCLGHLQWVCALEDIASHINAASTLADNVIRKVQRITLGQFLASGNYNRYRTGCHNLFKVLAVVGLNNLYTHLGNNTSCQFEETTGAFRESGYFLKYSCHNQIKKEIAELFKSLNASLHHFYDVAFSLENLSISSSETAS